MGSKAQMGDGLGTTEMWSAVLINNGSTSNNQALINAMFKKAGFKLK